MKPKNIYLALCVAGTILPAYAILPFLREHGPDPRRLFEQVFSTPAGAFFGVDVLVSSLVLWVLVYVEGRRTGMKHLWAPILANLLVGVSSGLPLFLYMREARLESRSG